MTISRRAAGAVFEFPYITCRNISAPEDDAASRKVYSGHAPASSVLSLEDDENVREYLADAQGNQKHMPTLVHQAIRKTLEDQPDQFSILNGGMVIVARAVEVDDKRKILVLQRPSIINGSQTQGELERYFTKYRSSPNFFEPSIKFELIVTGDDGLIAEISIARNFQNDVRPISIAGRRGQLDELEAAVQNDIPGAKLRKSETDIDGEYLDTEKLIQVMFALMPGTLLKSLEEDGDASNKVFTYSQKTRCLKLFQRLVNASGKDCGNSDVYQYFLDIAGQAWKLYERWKSHPGFRGTGLPLFERENGQGAEVPDGMIFPIVSAFSAFMDRSGEKWEINIPEVFDESELIEAAAQAYVEIASRNPQTMGKSKACYSTLLRLTGLYARLGRAA
ncbi:MAG TPA: AIPR family protein [Xanthobacteraceae bacterium]|nr:AIPR family protein [Xanthobacteraceae bacterium]